MNFDVTEEEIKSAKHPHELFLINLITNHILVFVGLLGMAGSYPAIMLVTPAVSVSIILYLLYRAKRSLTLDSWFVACHWQVCARRSKLFIIMLLIMALAMLLLLLASGGDLRPQHYALGGAAILPTMLTVLVLIVMESDAVHQARTGRLPGWVVERFPDGAAKALEHRTGKRKDRQSQPNWAAGGGGSEPR